MADEGAIELRLDGDAAGIVRASRQAATAQEGLTRVEKALKKAADDTNKDLLKQVEANDRLKKRNDELSQALGRTAQFTSKQSAEMKRLSADYDRMVKDTGRAVNETAALRRELDQTQGAMKRVEGAGRNTFTGMLGGMKGVLSGLAGVGGALGAIRLAMAEYENMRDRSGAAADMQMTVSNARQEVVANMATESPERIKAALEAGAKAAQDSNVPEAVTQQAMAFGLSASNANVEATSDAVGVASKAFSYTPENIPLLVGSLLDMAKVTGSQDAMTNLGFMTQVGVQSRISDPLLQARNVPRALIALTNAGLSPEEASSLFGTITEGTGDFSGQSSGTAAAQLVKQINEFGAGSGLDKRLEMQNGYAPTFTERLAAIQSDPKLAEAMLKDASFEATFDAPLRNFVRGQEGGINQGFYNRLDSFSGGMDFAGVGENFLAAKSVDPLYAVAESERRGKSVVESLQLGDGTALSESVLRTTMDTLKASGAASVNMVPGVNPYEIQYRNRLARGEDPNTAGAAILEQHAASLEPASMSFGTALAAGPGGLLGYAADQLLSPTRQQADEWRGILDGAAAELRAAAQALTGSAQALQGAAGSGAGRVPARNP